MRDSENDIFVSHFPPIDFYIEIGSMFFFLGLASGIHLEKVQRLFYE